LVELVASAISYRSRIREDDWNGVANAIEPALPVYVATPWLDPLARMEVDAVASRASLGRADLRGIPRFHVLGVGGHQWSAELQSDLEDLPAPSLESHAGFGALTLSTYSLATGELRADVLDGRTELDVQVDGHSCAKKGADWTCGRGQAAKGRLENTMAEIGYRPRRCLAAALDDGATLEVRAENLELGDVLRGHVGFDDFNRRLRSDADVTVEIRVDGEVAGRWTFTDDEGWTPFAVATTPGSHSLTIVAQPSVRGTWGRGGYDGSKAHRFCFELRSFEEGAT
jgi:hypothetical protein